MAEGRDHPVERTAVSDADYVALGQNASSVHIDTSDWAKLDKNSVSGLQPQRVCAGLSGFYTAALTTPGDAGERVLAGLASEMAITDASVYEPVIRQ
jgi:hypothetical protein